MNASDALKNTGLQLEQSIAEKKRFLDEMRRSITDSQQLEREADRSIGIATKKIATLEQRRIEAQKSVTEKTGAISDAERQISQLQDQLVGIRRQAEVAQKQEQVIRA